MKALLERDQHRLLYGPGGAWVLVTAQAREFAGSPHAEELQTAEHLDSVKRLDPKLVARLSYRVPGAYQAGE